MDTRTIPAALYIESALDALADRDDESVRAEAAEFRRAVTDTTLTGQLLPADLSPAEKGYVIGLATARVVLALKLPSGKGMIL